METVEQRPPFLWDYDLTERQVRQLITSGSLVERCWLTERILMQAQWDEIWRYLTPQQIRDLLPHLKLPHSVKDTWERALSLWLDGSAKSPQG